MDSPPHTEWSKGTSAEEEAEGNRELEALGRLVEIHEDVNEADWAHPGDSDGDRKFWEAELCDVLAQVQLANLGGNLLAAVEEVNEIIMAHGMCAEASQRLLAEEKKRAEEVADGIGDGPTCCCVEAFDHIAAAHRKHEVKIMLTARDVVDSLADAVPGWGDAALYDCCLVKEDFVPLAGASKRHVRAVARYLESRLRRAARDMVWARDVC